MIKVVALPGSFANTGKDANSSMLSGNVVDHFHHDHGLTDAGTSKHSHFSTAWKGNKKINNLYACLKNINRCILLIKGRRRPMDRIIFLAIYGAKSINRSAYNV